jgi:hypothetical protein
LRLEGWYEQAMAPNLYRLLARGFPLRCGTFCGHGHLASALA